MAATGASTEQIAVVDFTDPYFYGKDALTSLLSGYEAVIIGTSAQFKPTRGTDPDTQRPMLGFPDGQPYIVDWLGQRRQIDAAQAAGVDHVVICGSMGGTDATNMINSFGREANSTKGGGILLWKRKAEKYLVDSGMDYTILHHGGFLAESGGRRSLVVGVDDKLMHESEHYIPREDVAEVLLQSVLHKEYRNRSFDIASRPHSGAKVVTDFVELLQPLQGANCDYSLGVIPDHAAEVVEEEARVVNAEARVTQVY
jgi:uncharacterized protein YbjT (DUF2867 family)